MIANVAIPSFFPHSIATLVGILLIAALEGWFLKRLPGLGFSECYGHSLIANLGSTVVGIPVAWLLWSLGMLPLVAGVSVLGIEVHPMVNSVVFQSAFRGGFIPNEWSEVVGAGAWIVSLLPFWLGSVWIERRILRKRLPDMDPARISGAVIRGNLASYSFFLVLGSVALFESLSGLPERRERLEEQRQEREARIRDRHADRE